jgi:hypothetical protein
VGDVLFMSIVLLFSFFVSGHCFRCISTYCSRCLVRTYTSIRPLLILLFCVHGVVLVLLIDIVILVDFGFWLGLGFGLVCLIRGARGGCQSLRLASFAGSDGHVLPKQTETERTAQP